MKTSQYLTILCILSLLTACRSTKSIHSKPIALINNVSYKNAEFNNDNASNGFLVRYDRKDYVITAKHIMLIAKTDKMKYVDFEGELAEWKLHPKGDPSSYILTDKLLNPNRKDLLTWDYLSDNWDQYDDYLVFSVKENNSKHKPLKFRSTPLTKGEKLYAVGWSYSDTLANQPVYEYSYEETSGNYLTLKEIKGPTKMGGLSGSPIVDEKGEVVGLVSSGWKDEETNEVFVEATNTVNMLKFLKNLAN